MAAKYRAPSSEHFYCGESAYGCETLTPGRFPWLRGGVLQLYDFSVKPPIHLKGVEGISNITVQI
jgi:hypothetical protein